MRSLTCSLLLVVFSLSLFGSSRTEQLASNWQILGAVEDGRNGLAYRVAREATPGGRVIVSLHELTSLGKNPDGSIWRVYRDEPCVLYLDGDKDGVMSPKDRRYKMPNDHACPLTHLPLTIAVTIDDAAKTVALAVTAKRDDPHTASFSTAQLNTVERQQQMPGLD